MLTSSSLLSSTLLPVENEPSTSLSATHLNACGCSSCCSVSADFTSDGSVVEEDFVLQSTNFRWRQPGGKGTPITLKYSYTNLFDGGVTGGISTAQMKAAVEESFKLWSRYAPLKFVEVQDVGPKSRTKPNAADIRIGHEDLGGKGGTLGRARLSYDGELATTVSFDNRDSWAIDGTRTQSDFLFVAAHEIGHALGLRHEVTNNAIMQPSSSDVYAGLGSAFLYADDINGIRELYGQGQGGLVSGGGNTPPPVSPKPPSPKPKPNNSGSNAAVIKGTQRRDVLKGSNRSQTFRASGGNDTVFAGGGNDRAWGGAGNDVLSGEAGNDRLSGEGGNDKLIGGAGKDQLAGRGGRDQLIGVNAKAGKPGLNERDILIGGGDKDLFVLGDRAKVYYNDGRNNTLGRNDYAFIQDFNAKSGDKIQLKGRAKNYRIGSAPKGTRGGRGIFLQTSGQDELIAIVKNNSGLTLQSSAFRFV